MGQSEKGITPSRGSFASRFGIIAAAAGSAIGLGNIWRFPYLTGQNGGAAFLLVYLLFIIGIGIPVMLSEFVLGRATQRNPVGAFKMLEPGKPWFLVGFMGVLAAFVILAFYGAVAGWTMEYLANSVTNAFSGKTTEEIATMFDTFLAHGYRPVFWQLFFMFLTALIVWAGVEKGIEKYAKVLTPMLLVIVLLLDFKALTLEGGTPGLQFLFSPDFSKLSSNSILEALGQAFFSLSIGMGTLITYGSYIRKSENLPKSAVIVSFSDTLVAVLAGVAIFPAVFAFGIAPGSGPELVFKTLPMIFQQMTGGMVFAALFFILLLVAALTSSISILEVVVVYAMEELRWGRKKATLIATLVVSFFGVICALSWSKTASWIIFDKNVFDLFDFAASNILLPLGGLFIVIYLGWFYGKGRVWREISNRGTLSARFLHVYMFVVKYVAPVAIAAVFLHGFGVF